MLLPGSHQHVNTANPPTKAKPQKTENKKHQPNTTHQIGWEETIKSQKKGVFLKITLKNKIQQQCLSSFGVRGIMESVNVIYTSAKTLVWLVVLPAHFGFCKCSKKIRELISKFLFLQNFSSVFEKYKFLSKISTIPPVPNSRYILLCLFLLDS